MDEIPAHGASKRAQANCDDHTFRVHRAREGGTACKALEEPEVLEDR